MCYDLRFPEMYQLLACHLGAQIMLVPSAFTVATGTHMHASMHTCMQAFTHTTPVLLVFSLGVLLQVFFSASSVLLPGDLCFVEVSSVIAPVDSVRQALG